MSLNDWAQAIGGIGLMVLLWGGSAWMLWELRPKRRG